MRARLSRHPVGIECVTIAHQMTGGAVDLVVFEGNRAFVVASSTPMVLQPRSLVAAERELLASDLPFALGPDGSAAAIRGTDGSLMGALVTDDEIPAPLLDSVAALCRVVAHTVEAGAAPGEGSIERAVLEGLRDTVVVLDGRLDIVWANAAIGSLLSRSARELIGTPAMDLLHPEDIPLALEGIARLARGLEMYRVVVRLARDGGAYERVEVTGMDHSASPEIGGLVLSLRNADGDDELRVSADRAARLSTSIIENLHDGIVATDEFGEITTINRAARELFGLDPQRPAAQFAFADLEMFDRDGNPRPLFTERPRHDEPFERGEAYVVSGPGDICHVTIERTRVLDANRAPLGHVHVLHDITEARRAAAELNRQALHDQLTGLANRRQLDNHLHRLSSAEMRDVAALFIDLDGFKLVNDNHGHRIGDEIIRIAAQRIRSSAADASLIVRQGGDEFLVLLDQGADRDGVVSIADDLRRALGEPYVVQGDRFDLTASIGVAFASSGRNPEDLLLRHADLALYAAKGRGRNRTECFDNDLATAVEIEERQRRGLRRALEEEALAVHLQPIVHASGGEPFGYEALVRCPNEKGELLGPAAFMGAIQGGSIMWDLDQTAFALSCRAAYTLAVANPGSAPSIACNFSPISLQQPGLVEFIVETAAAAGVEPAQLCVEITESAAFDSGQQSISRLRELKAHGFRLALDDFGTGYSSLAHLRDLPLDVVKVDRSFVGKLMHRASPERAIAKSIVSLCGDLGLDVIAEGVETVEQLDEARHLGFTHIQGWYYAPARSLSDILADQLSHPRQDSNLQPAR